MGTKRIAFWRVNATTIAVRDRRVLEVVGIIQRRELPPQQVRSTA